MITTELAHIGSAFIKVELAWILMVNELEALQELQIFMMKQG